MYRKTIEALYSDFVNSDDQFHFITDDNPKYEEFNKELEEFSKKLIELLIPVVGERKAIDLIETHEELSIGIVLKDKHDAYEYGFLQGLSLGGQMNK